MTNHNLLPFAKTMRTNPTDAEKIIWMHLRRKQFGMKFKRQQPIGSYIVDFVCFEQRLIIEIDGGQHTPEIDAVRTNYLHQQEFQIIRFWNNEVIGNREGVFQTIAMVLTPPLPDPLPRGEREQ